MPSTLPVRTPLNGKRPSASTHSPTACAPAPLSSPTKTPQNTPNSGTNWKPTGSRKPVPNGATWKPWSPRNGCSGGWPRASRNAFEDPAPGAVPESADGPHWAAGWNFWRRGGQAADGREVVGIQDLVHAIRAAGAKQPILAMSWQDDRLFEGAGSPDAAPLIDDADIVYEASPRYASTRTDADRDAHFGFLATRAPVLANDWDLHLNDLTECAAIPSDPSAAAELVQGNLNYFDAHGISWMVSAYEPGKLIAESSLLGTTTMENGWTCGHASAEAGMGTIVLAHMRSTVERGLFVMSTAGGPDVARGGYAIAYGPVMAERDAQSSGPRLPLTLGGVSVQVTDGLGVTRPAGIYFASAGWGQINFVIPAVSAVGPGSVTIVRADGSRASANLIVTDAAPGFWTAGKGVRNTGFRRRPPMGIAHFVLHGERQWNARGCLGRLPHGLYSGYEGRDHQGAIEGQRISLRRLDRQHRSDYWWQACAGRVFRARG